MNLIDESWIALKTAKTLPIDPQNAIPLLDLTLLNPQASSEEIVTLAAKAKQYEVAAVCVMPQHLELITPFKVKRATVVNFPTGNESHWNVLSLVKELATEKRTDEIDYVFPYTSYLEGQQSAALSYCHEIYECCQQNGIVFKVIIETGAIPSCELIYQICTEIIKSGCDFLKTSTGKITQGATIPAVYAILKAIKNAHVSCGLKVSGGIKTAEEAKEYMQLASFMLEQKVDKHWFRIGASSLLDVLAAYKDN